eukprot:g11737.t1
MRDSGLHGKKGIAADTSKCGEMKGEEKLAMAKGKTGCDTKAKEPASGTCAVEEPEVQRQHTVSSLQPEAG